MTPKRAATRREPQGSLPAFQRAAHTPPTHRYKVGEEVVLARGLGYARVRGAVYEVTQLLPADRAHFQYRIRSQAEAFTRVAAENELTRRVP